MKIKLTNMLFGLGILFMGSHVHANTVQINPVTQTVLNGNNFNLTVAGTGFEETAGGSFIVGWDPSAVFLNTTALELVGFDFFNTGTMGANGFTFSNVVNIDHTAGLISIAAGTGVSPPKSGDFDIATLNFTAHNAGITQTTLTVGTLNWVDGNGALLTNQPTFDTATVHINAVPVPAAAWLFGTGFIGLVGIGRRRILQVA